MLMAMNLIKKVFLIFVLLKFSFLVFSQNADSTKVTSHFGGAVTVTNNGISFIPNFTLGKPAAIFDMSVRKGKLSFEPQFRFALEGKPWSFIFWWRYEVLKTNKFQINVGAHPSVVFRTIPFSDNGSSKNIIIAEQYLAGELFPNYFLSKQKPWGLEIFLRRRQFRQ